jgi:hypothetical protein
MLREQKDKPTERAVLMSEGCHRPTWHAFVRREEVPLSSLRGPRDISSAVGLIFRCEETGVERRWGLE